VFKEFGFQTEKTKKLWLMRKIQILKTKSFKDSVWNLVDFFSSIVFTLASIKIIISSFNQEYYGLYALLTGFAATFGLVDVGMGIAISKYLSEYIPQKEYNKGNQIILAGIIYYTAIGITIITLTILFSAKICTFLSIKTELLPIANKAISLISISVPIGFISSIFLNVLIATEKWKYITLINIASKFTSFALVFYFSIHHKFLLIFYSLLIIVIFKGVLTYVISLKYFKYRIVLIGKKVFVMIFNFIKYTFVQYLMSLFFGHLDKLIISKYFGLAQVGYYDFAGKIHGYIHSFNQNLIKISFPKLSYLSSIKNKSEFNKAVKINYLITYSSSATISLLLVFAWKTIISIYINKEFALASYNYMLLFCVLVIIRVQEINLYYICNAIGKPKILALSTFLIGPINILLYILLVPHYSEIGLIISQLISNILVYSGITLILKKQIYVIS